jgi:spermidine synthase
MMTHIFGATILAVSTVLAAFMTGLALGSYYLGKKGDKTENPLKRYAIYEVGIGLAALVTLALLDQIAPLSVWMTQTFGYSFTLFSIGRFIVVFLLILVPTTLMGATLPILSRFMIKRFENMGRSLGSLYVSNTLGAVCGGLVAGFYLIGNLGIHNSIYLAVVLNLGVGIVSWFVAKALSDSPEEAETEAVESIDQNASKTTRPTSLQKRQRALLLTGFALSGVTSFAYQVLWTRALVFYVGNSTYAFTIMLTTFLVGIAIGGYLVRFFVDRLKEPLRCFAWLQVDIGMSAVVAMPLLNIAVGSTGIITWFASMDIPWGATVLPRFAISFSLVLIPTVLVGMTFPLVGKILVTNLDRTGEDVGKVYAVNTLGNIVGALLPAFALVPLLGINKGILAMSVTNIAIGFGLFAYGRNQLSRRRHLAPVAIIALVALVLAAPMTSRFSSDTESPEDEVLFYREGVVGTTKVYVKQGTGEKHISVDGIQIGGTNFEIDYKQQWLAHLPKLLMSEYRSELSIGLGSGILIGESAKHTTLEKIVGVEIAPSVVEGARYFDAENNGILDSPRVDVVVNDGVNYLLTTEEKFDIISTDGKTLPEYGVNGVFFFPRILQPNERPPDAWRCRHSVDTIALSAERFPNGLADLHQRVPSCPLVVCGWQLFPRRIES